MKKTYNNKSIENNLNLFPLNYLLAEKLKMRKSEFSLQIKSINPVVSSVYESDTFIIFPFYKNISSNT
jgi:hypothetical protein